MRDEGPEGCLAYLIRAAVVFAFLAFAVLILLRMLDWRIGVWTRPPATAPATSYRH